MALILECHWRDVFARTTLRVDVTDSVLIRRQKSHTVAVGAQRHLRVLGIVEQE